ncbi:MAG: Gldg family protein [Hyphomicrobiales bacterium]|nr:Gldg family protein [Hyphomicrobiales bacterium]
MSEQTSSQREKGAGAPVAPETAWTAGRIAVIAALLGGVIFVCVNLVGAQLFRSARVDLTEQHLFSLSAGTRALLADLKEPVRFRFFMSSGLTKQAPQLAAFAARVRSLLDAYVAAANGKIVLEVIDPRPFSEDEDRAVAFGIDGFAGTNGERLFFGLAATDSTAGRAVIRVFAPDREPFLEYDLTRLVSELGRRGKPVVALIDGLGLAGNPMMRMPEQQVLTQMKQFFDVKPLTGEVEKLPESTRVLMVVHPQELTERTLYTIDQWVLAGNPAIIFVDPVAENQVGPRGTPPPSQASNLDTLFKAWGVKFDPARAVGDPEYALQTEREIAGRPVSVRNLPWVALRGDALARDEAILNQLSAVVMTTAGAFETNKDGVSLRPLIKASKDAVMVDAALAGDRAADPRRLLVGTPKNPTPPVVAGRLTGTLDSAFPDGPPKDGKDSGQAEPIKRSSKPINVVLVGDADMLMDRNWIQRQSLFGQQLARAFANNGDFVINAIEQMAGGAALSDLRGRGVSWRPFEMIQRMEGDAESRYSAKEQELTQRLKDIEQKLAQLPKAAEGSKEVLSAEQLNAIEGFRNEMLRIRSELRDVQFALRRDVDNLKGWVTALNVGVVPVGAAIVVLALALRRPRRPLPGKAGQKGSEQP